MKVHVQLYATLQTGKFNAGKTELADNSRVIDVINRYGLPEEEVHICFVNGRDADKEQVLHDGDTVSLFPKIGGA